MKFRILFFSLLINLGLENINAQEVKGITLEQAVGLALTNSDAAKIADAKVTTAIGEVNVTKNNQYPDFDISGQYLYLTNADINIKYSTTQSDPDPEEADTGGSPSVDGLLIGQASISMPVFSGFKLKNLLKASENQYQAAIFNSKDDKEQLALQTIITYVNLYKATQTVELVNENLKSTQQRVKDFQAMEQNGILARNDLLKAQLQESNVQLTLEEAIKNRNILNYKLAVYLKLPQGTEINPTETSFGPVPQESGNNDVSRNDLQALQYQEQAAENQIKVAQSKYYPSLSLTGGYIALDVHNALTVKNAMNVGVGLSYNLADIFKTKSDVKVAQSRVEELQFSVDRATDQITVQIENAKQDYNLELRKFEVYTKSEEQA
ncbi:MAG: TolC family protein, partial [Leeuwenhoekiella sp.]